MSFIYVEKNLSKTTMVESVRVLCDTKIMPNEYTTFQFSDVQNNWVLKYGIVKSTICNPQLCISFAGNNILYAAKLFTRLKDIGSFENENVAKLALDVHKEAAAMHGANDPRRYDDIEFIITYYCNGSIHIDCVKNGTIGRDLPLAHIGSEDAFSVFQKSRLSFGDDAVDHTESVFKDVVAGCIDTSVGGRVIEIIYDHTTDSFVFQWQKAFHSGKTQIVKPGEDIVFYTSAEDGGYSYEVIHQDIHNVFFIIDQMKHAILYSKQFRVSENDLSNPNLFGLMLPLLVKIEEDGGVRMYG